MGYGFGILFTLILTLMLVIAFGFKIPAAANEEKLATDAEAAKATTDNTQTAAAQVLTDVQPTLDKLNFVKAVHDYNIAWVELYDKMARYTDPKIIYSGAEVSGQTMQIKAYAPSIAEMGRYLEEIYKEPDFTTVSIDHLPGYPEAVVNKYYLDGKLIGISSPSGTGGGSTGVGYTGANTGTGRAGFGAGGGFAGQRGFGGGGFGGGFPGGPRGGFGGGGFGGGGFSGRGGGGFGQSGQIDSVMEGHVWSVEDVLQDQIDPLATPQQRERTIERALKRVVVKQEPKGFDVTVTATLNKTFTPPAIPGGVSGGTQSGGFGGGFGGAPGPGYSGRGGV